MHIQSQNPYTEEVLETFNPFSESEIEQSIELAQSTFNAWKFTKFEQRKELTLKFAKLLRENAREIGSLASLEMGKPIKQAVAEVEKCAWVCEYYAENAEKFLSPQSIQTDAKESFARFDPLGALLIVMPWNFPYWQVIRCSAPAIMAGNTVLLKHASNVPKCALKIEELYIKAGFPKGVFQTLLIGSSQVEKVLRDSRVNGVSLTGSEYAGSQVAKVAGEEIKPVVLELGGSDPFIVLEDCDLDYTVSQAIVGRTQNNGQSCIAAKRFIVSSKIYDTFLEKFKAAFEALKIGDQMLDDTDIGPLVNEDAVADMDKFVADALKCGAKLITGGKRLSKKGFLYAPTILADIPKTAKIYLEEAFGPLASVYKFDTIDEAIEIANVTSYGLGSSIWTKNTELAKELAQKIDAGSVFINQIVRSHPALPFGGIKKSGVGRELGESGIKEFVNVKTVVVK